MTTSRIQRAINILDLNISVLKEKQVKNFLVLYDLSNINGWLFLEGINATREGNEKKLKQIMSAQETIDFVSCKLHTNVPYLMASGLDKAKRALLKIQELEEQ